MSLCNFKLLFNGEKVMTCLPAQDDTLVCKKSRNRFPIDADDWKPFNNKVYKIMKELDTDGYKIVVFRCARCFPLPRQGLRFPLDTSSPEDSEQRVPRLAGGYAATRRAWASSWRAKRPGLPGSGLRT